MKIIYNWFLLEVKQGTKYSLPWQQESVANRYE